MPRVLQLGESRAINKTSPSDWTNAIDGGLEVGPGTSIMLNRALIHKPGADLEESAGSITIDKNAVVNIYAHVGIVASASSPDQFGGLSPKPQDYKKYYLTHTDASYDDPVTFTQQIQIVVPAGTYSPSELCSLITDQTRTPYSLLNVPEGSITSPSVIRITNAITYNGLFLLDNKFVLEGIPRPTPPHVKSNLAAGTAVILEITDDLGNTRKVPTTIAVAPDDDGLTYVNTVFTGDDNSLTCTVGAGTHKWSLRKNQADKAGQVLPTAEDGFTREVYGCTTGISFTYDSTTGRVQMECHSPLYNGQNVSVKIGLDAAGQQQVSGIGPRGLLSFSSDSWGYSQSDWPDSLWAKLGFAYDDLNGSTGIDDPSGWVSSDGYFDASFDLIQSWKPLDTSNLWFQTQRSDGPRGQVLSLAPGTVDVGMWLIQVSLLPQTDETRWVHSDGGSVSGVVGVCTKTYASGDFFSSEGGPVWTLSKKQAPFTVGNVRVRILNAQDLTVDQTIGSGSMVLLEVS